MKGFIISTFLIVFFTCQILIAQNCKPYAPFEDGAILELTHYDHKDRVSSKSINRITNITEKGDDIYAEIDIEILDKKDKQLYKSSTTLSCVDGIFSVSMDGFFSPEQMQAYKDMEIEFEGENLTYPNNMKAGDELPGGSIVAKVKMEGLGGAMEIGANVYDRKVEAFEKITTPAGTFDCVKLTYNVKTKIMMMTVEASAIEWHAENIGLIKQESYNKRGKLTGKSILTKLVN